jgi:nucleoid-associated protein YgaU
MQQIERYGVIALVFLLVTIVAVSFWGDGKSPGFWSRLSGRGAPKKEAALAMEVATANRALDGQPPLSPVPPLPAGGNPSTASPTPGPVESAPNGPELIEHSSNDGGQLPPPLEPNPTGIPARGDSTAAEQGVPVESVPQPGGPARHVVQKGESLAAIAKSRLGDETRWREIESLNPGLDPKRLQVGQTLQLPTGAAPAKAAKPSATKPVQAKDAPKLASPKPAPKASAPKSTASAREHVVARGETLRAIARSRLGDADRWREIVAANPGLDPERLRVGAKLRLPGGERAAPVSPKREKETAPVVAIQKPVVR